MCYSAMVKENYRKLQREYGGEPDWPAIKRAFWRRVHESKSIQISKGMELAFEHPSNKHEEEIKALIVEYRTKRELELSQELFEQKTRLVDAERKLKTKTTKKALDDQRIAAKKIPNLIGRIADVKRTEFRSGDDRIFPMWWSMIVVEEDGKRKIIPARYHCRPAGMPEYIDVKYDGLYNARRTSLENFWRGQFGQHHAVMRVSSFYENVKLHKYEHRDLRPGEKEKNLVLYFNPTPSIEMNVACLWSRWSEDLVSFAAITDEPNPEVAAAGHDRTIINIASLNVDAWLSPQGRSMEELYRIFDDRERPYFEHLRIAA
jgi:putative SOS response-associated peptidase YedK